MDEEQMAPSYVREIIMRNVIGLCNTNKFSTLLCACSHSGELIKIPRRLIPAVKGAGGNNPDQCAASVMAICHNKISQGCISLQLSDSISVCHRAAG